jgi:hypothetical protein
LREKLVGLAQVGDLRVDVAAQLRNLSLRLLNVAERGEQVGVPRFALETGHEQFSPLFQTLGGDPSVACGDPPHGIQLVRVALPEDLLGRQTRRQCLRRRRQAITGEHQFQRTEFLHDEVCRFLLTLVGLAEAAIKRLPDLLKPGSLGAAVSPSAAYVSVGRSNRSLPPSS